MDAAKRIKIRATNPREHVLELFQSQNYLEWCAEHKKFVEQELTVKPLFWYETFKKRLREDGREASFPEFRGVVGALVREIFQNKEHSVWFRENKVVELEQLIHTLISIQTQTRYMWPYSSTIYCIENMLGLLDVFYRTTSPTKYNAYYHNFRYRNYLSYVVNEPDQVCFPTTCVLWSQHFIAMRCVPVLLLGVAYSPLLADQYVNTPLDFWAHDLQHARRQIQETQRYYDIYVKHRQYYEKRSPFDYVSTDQFCKEQFEFSQKMYALYTDETLSVHMRNAIKMILFEIVHEKAWPMTRFSICRNIQKQYDVFPIENLVVYDGQIETEDHKFDDPTTLSNLVNKLRHGFFDPAQNPLNTVLAKSHRTSAFIVEACEHILDYLNLVGPDRYSSETLLALAKDTKNANEFLQSEHEIDIPDVPEKQDYPTGFVDVELSYFKD